MNKTAVVNYQERQNSNKGDKAVLRKEGFLLGNVSRRGLSSVSIAIKKDELRKTLKTYGRNAVIKLTSSGSEEYTVMLKEIQITPVTNEVQHVDFQQVSLTEEVKSDVALDFKGADLLEGKRLLLNRHLEVVPVSGYPQDIPDTITIDVSNLEAGDNVLISELTYPKNITPELDGEQIVISISEHKVQEVVESEDAAEDVVAAE